MSYELQWNLKEGLECDVVDVYGHHQGLSRDLVAHVLERHLILGAVTVSLRLFSAYAVTGLTGPEWCGHILERWQHIMNRADILARRGVPLVLKPVSVQLLVRLLRGEMTRNDRRSLEVMASDVDKQNPLRTRWFVDPEPLGIQLTPGAEIPSVQMLFARVVASV